MRLGSPELTTWFVRVSGGERVGALILASALGYWCKFVEVVGGVAGLETRGTHIVHTPTRPRRGLWAWAAKVRRGSAAVRGVALRVARRVCQLAELPRSRPLATAEARVRIAAWAWSSRYEVICAWEGKDAGEVGSDCEQAHKVDEMATLPDGEARVKEEGTKHLAPMGVWGTRQGRGVGAA